MAAYAALVSLMHLIDDIQNHHSPPIFLHKLQIQSLIEYVIFLQEFLKDYKSPVSDSDEADPLEMRIAKAAYAAEDVIESRIIQKIQHSRSKTTKIRSFFNWFPRNVYANHLDDDRRIEFYREVENVIEEMDRIKIVAMATNTGMKVVVLHDQPPRGVVPSSSGKKSSGTMVFSYHVMRGIMDKLMSNETGRQVIPITGMGGIGKTALAHTVYSDQVIKDRFDIRAWATISEQYNTRQILCELVSQATKKDNEQFSEKSVAELGLELYQYLSGRRFLIVMDDMWNIESWNEIQHLFPDNGNCGRIMVTTRQSQLSSQLNNQYSHQMEFLDESSSWALFSKTVFGDEQFPLELEKVGKEIAYNCRGLPLSIVVVGGILKNMEHTRESWKSIRNNLTIVVNSDNDKHCLRLLKMSYDHLPVYLKPCFLYMGVFEEDEEIHISKLIKSWVGEGFLKPIDGQSLETIGKGFLEDLADRNVILVEELGSTGNIKRVRVHDLVRDLCVNQGKKEGFYHVIGESSPGGIENHRRIVIRRNTSKKKVIDDLKSMSHARSIICQDGIVPWCRNLGLLRTTQAWTSRVFQYVNLRHIEDNYGASNLSSVNQLWNLQTLIFPRTSIFRFNEIWEMPQLRHIEMVSMPPAHPSCDAVVMENLVVLKGALNFKWDDEVAKRFPNIKKLKLLYSWSKGMGCDEIKFLCKLECFCKLESLYISNRYGYEGKVYSYKITFPQTLKSLNLRMDSSFEWGTMLEMIGSLLRLEKLKLYGGCFGTGKWEISEGQFPCLKYLELGEWDGLKNWTAEASSIFPRLENLVLIRMEELENIPYEIGDIPTLQKILMIGCRESVVKCAKDIVEEQMDCQGDDLPFHVFVRPSPVDDNKAMQNFAGPNFVVEE